VHWRSRLRGISSRTSPGAILREGLESFQEEPWNHLDNSPENAPERNPGLISRGCLESPQFKFATTWKDILTNEEMFNSEWDIYDKPSEINLLIQNAKLRVVSLCLILFMDFYVEQLKN
jgi:hypothetical protein